MLKSLLKTIVIFILTLEARLVLKKYKPKIIAVTGSVGKTTTKDAVCEVISSHFFTRCSDKSFNSDIGIPLTVLGCQNGWKNSFLWLQTFLEGLALIVLRNHYPKIIILEVGTDKPGDIKRIASWIKPDIVIVTRLGEVPVHIEFFASREALIEEKMNLVYAMKDGGILVLNADDRDVYKISQSDSSKKSSILTFGVKENAIIKASHTSILYDDNGYPHGITCKVEYKGKMFPLTLYGTVGTHHISAVLAAIGVGISLGINIVAILENILNFEVPPGRLKILRGKNDSLIIDDTYNSSPTAASAALQALHDVKVKGRKIAVLGDMLELGKYSSDEHKKIGAFVSHVADILIVIGPRAKYIEEGALEQGMKIDNIRHFYSSCDAGLFLLDFVGNGDIVLIKGSQSMRMEKAVECILLDSKKKNELLVRQEEEWKNR